MNEHGLLASILGLLDKLVHLDHVINCGGVDLGEEKANRGTKLHG